MLNDAGGQELLLSRYGLRKVPVVAKGDKYVFGQLLHVVATFVGLPGSAMATLAPTQVYEKYRKIFAAGQRYARQFPIERINERVIPNRERLIRTLCFHVFRIGEAFLETWDGAEYSIGITENLPDDSIQSGEDIARYGEQIWRRYEVWWAGQEDKSLSRVLKTFYGDMEAHQLFERTTWHSAQHCRQLVAVLERIGIPPDGPLTSEDLAGLPLPEKLWE